MHPHTAEPPGKANQTSVHDVSSGGFAPIVTKSVLLHVTCAGCCWREQDGGLQGWQWAAAPAKGRLLLLFTPDPS